MAELRIRRAEVTAADPLAIELPGADESVSALLPHGHRAEVGDIVSVLMGSGQPIVLGPTHTAPSIRFGTSSATFSALADSAEKTVAHGLAGTPAFVSVQYKTGSVGATAITSRIITLNATNFSFQMNAESSLSTTVDVFWLAAL